MIAFWTELKLRPCLHQVKRRCAYPLAAWHSPALGILGPKPQPLPRVGEGRVEQGRVRAEASKRVEEQSALPGERGRGKLLCLSFQIVSCVFDSKAQEACGLPTEGTE